MDARPPSQQSTSPGRGAGATARAAATATTWLPSRRAGLAALALGLVLAGCNRGAPPGPGNGIAAGRTSGPLAPSYQPRRLGRGPQFRPPSLAPAVSGARPIPAEAGGPPMRCLHDSGARYGSHVELFVSGRVVGVPAGIGIAPPRRRDGARVTGGRCTYPVRSTEPTGVIELSAGQRRLLGDLFAIWGQPLSRRRVAGFRAGPGGVRIYIDGRRVGGDPRRVALARHAQIVLEVGQFVSPHPLYLFPPGL